MRTLLACLVAIVVLTAPVFGSGDIVYSARYYNPPGCRKPTSHFHLYSINPDGAGRRQLTVGREDDTDPQWSPDGRRILFVHGNQLRVIDPRGKHGRLIAVARQYPRTCLVGAAWWPDGKRVFLPGNPARLIDVRTRRATTIHGDYESFFLSPSGAYAWTSDCNGGGTVVAVRGSTVIPVAHRKSSDFAAWTASEKLALYTFNVDGKGDALTTFDLTGGSVITSTRSIPTIQSVPRSFLAIPGTSRKLLIGSINTHFDSYYQMYDLSTNTLKTWLEMQSFVVFHPDGRYVTARYDVIPYGPDRQVWGGDMCIGKGIDDLHPKPIVHGLVCIDGADWRR